MERLMPSDIPIGIAPIFRRLSATKPAPGNARADRTRPRETGNETPAAAAPVPAPSTPTTASAGGEAETSADVVVPSPTPSPASTWEELIASAEKRFAAPAPEPAPPATRELIAGADDDSNLDYSEPHSAPATSPSRVAGPALPHAPVSMSAAERMLWRHGCNWLELFRLCRRSRCRHARRCRGEPKACLHAGVRHAPESVREFVIGMIKAQELGLSFDEAFDDAADCHDAYFAWVAGLQAAQRK
jgi:hypothetical protein